MERNNFNIENIEAILGYVFKNKELISLAFIHSSYLNENKGNVLDSNERLEFLGDSVLGLIIAEYLYSRFPLETEGRLSTLRSSMVDATACAAFASKLQLDQFLILGKGEKMNEGKGRVSILADLFEAIVGAIYLDRGYTFAKEFFFSHFGDEIEQIIGSPKSNWKAELQEYIQKKYAEPPHYEVVHEWGPSHDKNFRVAVFAKNEKLAEGEGSSKKIAQQNAAEQALIKLLQE